MCQIKVVIAWIQVTLDGLGGDALISDRIRIDFDQLTSFRTMGPKRDERAIPCASSRHL